MGTAMRCRCAVCLANIFLDQLETQILHSAPDNLRPLLWKRFIDDIFLIWVHGRTKFQTFLKHLNSFHPTINFEGNTSEYSVDYLDTTVYLTPNGEIRTNIFNKPTDTGLLLHFKSEHSLNCKISVVFSQCLRYRLLITEDSKFLKALEDLKLKLIVRGYPKGLIERVFGKVKGISQNDLVYKEYHKTRNVIPFIIPYSINTKGIAKYFWEGFGLIESDLQCLSILQRPPVVANTKGKNLKDFTVHTKFSH